MYHPCFFDVFCGSFEDCRLSFTRSSWSWVIPPKCRHLHKRRPHIPGFIYLRDKWWNFWASWRQSGHYKGWQKRPWSQKQWICDNLRSQQWWERRLSVYQNPCSKVKTLLFFWDVNFSEGGSRSFKVFDADRANLLKNIWKWYWSSKSILQGKHHQRICGSFGGDVNLMEFSQVLTLTFSESNKNTSSILKSWEIDFFRLQCSFFF